MRHDDVERIRGTALKETDERLALLSLDQLRTERRPAKKARAQSKCDQCKRT
jgi:hypothetical protein